MPPRSITSAVTGANKGIGLAIVKNLAIEYPASPLHPGSLLIYLTARSAERGAEAVKKLNSDPQLKEAKVLAQDGGATTIAFKSLDISDESSIHSFRDFLQKEHPEGIDILINNAGIAMDGFDDNVVKQTIHTNYYGSLAMTQEILPLIKPGGVIVNVCSKAGRLSQYSETLRQAFISASQSSIADCSALMEKFKADVKEKKEKQEGWPSAGYMVSKAGEIAMTKSIALGEEKTGSGIKIYPICPGYVNTDMTKGRGPRTVDQGSKTPVWLALGKIGGKTGEFYEDEKVTEW